MGSSSGVSSELTQSISAMVHPSLNSLMMSHTFLSLLIPLAISLFYFSTPDNRRKPVFLLNVGAIVLAFIVCVLVDASTIHTILHPLNPWHLNTAAQFIAVWQSILVDLTLLIRLISVYPLKQIGPKRFALLISIPIFLKLTRAINLILFAKVLINTLHGSNATTTSTVFVSKPYVKIEWGTQMMDNAYVSLGFLWKIRGQGNIIPKARSVTLTQRMRTLFQISFTNFVVPTMFSIAQFVSVYHGVGMTVLDQLVLVNMMLSTLGVVCTTIWACGVSRQEAQAETIRQSCCTFQVAHVRYPANTHEETSSSLPGTRKSEGGDGHGTHDI